MVNSPIGSMALRDLLVTTKDGDWGKDSPEVGFDPFRVIRGADFTEVRIGNTTSIPIRYLSRNTVHRRILKPDDIILETAGGSPGRPTGRSLFITEKLLSKLDLPVTCASFARFLRVDPKKAVPHYVYWYLQYLYFSGQMEEHQVQHTGVARFQYTKFAENMKIPIPSEGRQHEITNILSALDDKIELNYRKNETLQALIKAIFKSWFIDFDPVRAKIERKESLLPDRIQDLFSSGFEDSQLGEIPRGWSVQPIGELAEVIGGSTPSTKEPSFWEDGTHCWATPKDLSGLASPILLESERRITDAGLAQIGSGLLPIGTVLLSSRAPIGYLAIAQVPTAINQGFIAMIPKSGVSNIYLLIWASLFHDEIVSRANGSTFLEISKSSFRPIPVVAPPAKLMAEFDRHVQPIFNQIAANERENRTLLTTRDLLLPRLFSGDLVVNTVGTTIAGSGR
jgi:type I restriction enzyme S subunit